MKTNPYCSTNFSPEYIIFEEALFQSQLVFCMSSSSSLIYLCTKKVWQFWKMRSWSKTASKLQNEIKSLMSRKTMPEVFWFVLIFQPFSFQTVFGNNNISTLRYSSFGCSFVSTVCSIVFSSFTFMGCSRRELTVRWMKYWKTNLVFSSSIWCLVLGILF